MDCDILVIGAGALGMSSAYHLKEKFPGLKVVVVDKYGGSAQGNSAKSEGAFRNMFVSETNYMLANSSIDWFQHMQDELDYDLKIHRVGYLWLHSREQFNNLKTGYSRMREQGAELRYLEGSEINDCIPDLVTHFDDDEDADLMNLQDVDYGVYGKKCGSLDADSMVKSYEKEFHKLGGETLYNVDVNELLLKPEEELDIPGEPFIWQNKVIKGARTSKGEITADTTVLATGTWASQLLEPIGLDSYIRPKKRQLFAFKDPKLKGLLNVKNLNSSGGLPLTILPTAGVYLKSELTEGSLWVGCADDLGRKFELEEDAQPESDYYTNNIYHVIEKYFPCFNDIRPLNSWAGQYAINSLDGGPIVEPHPGLIYVGGASGSGIMKCDAIGRVAAAAYAGSETVELFDGSKFRVADIGISDRSVKKESMII